MTISYSNITSNLLLKFLNFYINLNICTNYLGSGLGLRAVRAEGMAMEIRFTCHKYPPTRGRKLAATSAPLHVLC